MTNFELLGFVPLGCVTRGMTWYDQVWRFFSLSVPTTTKNITESRDAWGDQVAFKMMTPVAAIGLLTCPTLYHKLRGKPSDDAWRTVKRRTMLLLELTLPGITTSLIQVFLCEQFDDGAFLRESLTMACDDSDQRKFWVACTCIGIVVFPIGGESKGFNIAFFCTGVSLTGMPRVAHSPHIDLHDHVHESARDPETGRRDAAVQPASSHRADREPTDQIEAGTDLFREPDDGNSVAAPQVREVFT